MLKRSTVLAALALLAAATVAQAAPVQRTVEAAMDLVLNPREWGAAGFHVTGTGTVTVDTATGTIVIPAGLVQLTAKTVVPVTATTTIISLSAKVMSNQAGTLSLGGATHQLPGEVCSAGLPSCVVGGGVGGAMGLTGAFYIVDFPRAVGALPIYLDDLRIGQGGSTNIPFTIDAAAWTNATGVVTTPDGTESVHGSGSIGGPSVVFVTPTFVSALGNILPFYTTLHLDFVPEPGTALLLGAGVVGLAMAARARSRR